jgi:hypothetical protein
VCVTECVTACVCVCVRARARVCVCVCECECACACDVGEELFGHLGLPIKCFTADVGRRDVLRLEDFLVHLCSFEARGPIEALNGGASGKHHLCEVGRDTHRVEAGGQDDRGHAEAHGQYLRGGAVNQPPRGRHFTARFFNPNFFPE